MRVLFPFFLLLAGCATDIATTKQPWYDATYEQVVASWGKPSGTSKLDDGTEVHVWVAQGPAVQPSSRFGVGVFGGSGGVSVGTGVGIHVPVGGGAQADRCERRLHFRGGRVVDQEWIGSDAYCEVFRRPD